MLHDVNYDPYFIRNGAEGPRKVRKVYTVVLSPWLVILNHECGYLIGGGAMMLSIIGLPWILSEFARSGDAASSADLTQQVRLLYRSKLFSPRLEGLICNRLPTF